MDTGSCPFLVQHRQGLHLYKHLQGQKEMVPEAHPVPTSLPFSSPCDRSHCLSLPGLCWSSMHPLAGGICLNVPGFFHFLLVDYPRWLWDELETTADRG